jgi:chemotaxis protein CheD
MRLINVHIGEIKIAKNGEVLKTILGSCVGIGFIWKQKNLCGLAHCLLPETPIKTFEIGGRYVNQAVPALMAMMKIHEENISEIEVVIAGGGNMTNASEDKSENLVGSQNIKMALSELQKRGFRILQNKTGGHVGRKITIYGASLTYQIESIPRIASAS